MLQFFPHEQRWELQPVTEVRFPRWDGETPMRGKGVRTVVNQPATGAVKLTCRRCGRPTQPLTARTLGKRVRLVDWSEDRFAGLSINV